MREGKGEKGGRGRALEGKQQSRRKTKTANKGLCCALVLLEHLIQDITHLSTCHVGRNMGGRGNGR